MFIHIFFLYHFSLNQRLKAEPVSVVAKIRNAGLTLSSLSIMTSWLKGGLLFWKRIRTADYFGDPNYRSHPPLIFGFIFCGFSYPQLTAV